MNELERKVMELSDQLGHISLDTTLRDMCEEIIDDETFNDMDALSYNSPCYASGKFWDGEINSHYYIKRLVPVGEYLCLRVIMISTHVELADFDKYSITNGDEAEIDRLIRIADTDGCDDWCFSEELEVAQYWFAPNGKVLILTRDNKFNRVNAQREHDFYPIYAPISNWVNIGEGRQEDQDGGWIDDSPLTPNYSEDIHNVLQSGLQYRDQVSSISHDAFKKPLFRVFRKFISDLGYLSEFSYDFDNYISRVSDPVAITLKEWGYNQLFSMFIADGFASCAFKYYHEIKIAHRNGFDATDSLRQIKWMELLETIKFCGGNLQDPRNYMPYDFDKMFEYWQVRKKNLIRKREIEAERKRKEEEERQRIEDIEYCDSQQELYIKHRGIFVGIVFGDDEIELRVLNTVRDFYDEGIEMKHCVFNNEYFNFPSMLLFSARDRKTGHRLSTVAYDLKNKCIFSNLTIGDQVPLEEEHINAILNAHKHLIDRDWQRMIEQDDTVAIPDPKYLEMENEERRYYALHHAEREQQRAENRKILAARAAKAARVEEQKAILCIA